MLFKIQYCIIKRNSATIHLCRKSAGISGMSSEAFLCCDWQAHLVHDILHQWDVVSFRACTHIFKSGTRSETYGCFANLQEKRPSPVNVREMESVHVRQETDANWFFVTVLEHHRGLMRWTSQNNIFSCQKSLLWYYNNSNRHSLTSCLLQPNILSTDQLRFNRWRLRVL